MMNSLERLQLIKSKCLRKVWAYCSADQVSISLIRVMRFKNLQVTDIRALNPSTLTGRARTKSRVKVKKGIRRDSMGCREL